MSAAKSLEQIQPNQKISVQMRAVLSIISSDPFLMDAVLPFIDFKNEAIEWDEIFRLPLSSGHRGACQWAFSLWTDNIRENANPFEAALSMDSNLQSGILKALKLRWGIRG